MNPLQFIYGFRKWTIMIIAIVVSVIFLITGHIRGDEFVDLHKVALPAFYGTNVGEHIIKETTKWLKEKSKGES